MPRKLKVLSGNCPRLGIRLACKKMKLQYPRQHKIKKPKLQYLVR